MCGCLDVWNVGSDVEENFGGGGIGMGEGFYLPDISKNQGDWEAFTDRRIGNLICSESLFSDR